MKLYKISIDEGKRKKYAEACRLSSKTVEDINCPVCETKWVKGIFDRPIEIILTNDNLPDYTAIFPVHFISEKFEKIIMKFSLSNIQFEEIKTITVNELNEVQIKKLKIEGLKVNKLCTVPSTYCSFSLQSGISIHSVMGVITHKCENCGRNSFKKLKDDKSMLLDFILDHNTWDGSDFFTIEGFPQCFICTERFIEVCKNENITGISFDKVEVRK